MLGALALATLPLSVSAAVTYTATYTPQDAPNQSEQGQEGTNKCGTGYNQASMCQNAYINSVTDFCLFAPPQPGPLSDIGHTERIEVSWCMQGNYGTRVIPDGTIQGAHFVQTPDYVQITGYGDLTKLNVLAGDEGGELDPHGADGNGNPIGGLVFSSAFAGTATQLHEWTNFMSATEFCFRGCRDAPNAPALCQHIYDDLGCMWNMPGNYATGSYDNCKGDSGQPMGVYGTSTFYQGEPVTPDAHPAPATSACTPLATISNGLNIAAAPSAVGSAPASAPASPISSSAASSSSTPSSALSSQSAAVTPSATASGSGGSGASASGPSRTGSSSGVPSASAAGSTANKSGAMDSAVPRVLVAAAAMVAAFFAL